MPKAVKSKRLLPRDPARLHSVEEWLRGFRERQLPNLPNVFYCRKCGIRIVASPDPITITHDSCGPIRRLDEVFWQRLSNRIKQHYRKDRLLFARLKAECSLVMSVPELQGPLAWVTIEWRKTAKPPGRPLSLQRKLFLASWLYSLARPRLVMMEKRPSRKEILTSSGKLRRFFSKWLSNKELRFPHWKELPAIMTLSGAILLLSGFDLKKAKGLRVPWRQNQLFGGLPMKELVQFRLAFREQWKREFGGVPVRLSRREVERMVKLYENIQGGWRPRIKGLKLRDRTSKKSEMASGPGIQSLDTKVESLLNRTYSKRVVGDV